MNSWIKFVIVFFSLFVGVNEGILGCSSSAEDAVHYNHDFFIEDVILDNLERFDNKTFYHKNETSFIYWNSNLDEWKNFFGNKIYRDNIEFWLYNSKLNDIDEILFYLENKTPIKNEKVKANGNIFFKYPKKAKAFFYYLGFARRNEVFTLKLNNEEYWIKESHTKNLPEAETVNILNQITGGLNLYKNEKFKFIRERYIFQIVRLYYFNHEYEKSTQFYNNHFSEIKLTDSMKWRTLGYVAASNTKLKKIGVANYIYSLLYTHSKFQKESAYLSFQPMEKRDWEESLKLAKNKNEKIILWYLLGKHFNISEAMKEIYQLEPNSKYLKMLFTSIIKNKSHSIFENGIKYKDYSSSQFNKIVPLKDNVLLANVNSIANQDRVKNKFGWKIAAAYLNYLSLNFKEGDLFLESASKLKGNVEVFEKQYQITSLLGKLLQMDTIDEKSEMSILSEIKFLFSKDKNISADLNLKFPREWVRGLLGVFYVRKGELEKAEWIQNGIIERHFHNLENAKRMIQFLEDNNSPLIRIILDNPMHSRDDYLLLLGIRYAQVEELESSLKTFNKITDSYWKENRSDYFSERLFHTNPFQIKIMDHYHFGNTKNKKYTHKTFIEKMIQLKKEAEANPNKTSKNYFKLANAFYNMNYFGTSNFHFNRIQNYSSNYGWEVFCSVYKEKDFYPELSSDIAMKYYLLARETSKNKEFKAKMTFMAAKCEQNDWYLTKDFKSSLCWITGDDAKDFQPGKYFQELRDIYSETKYHSEIIKECSYYARYYAKKSEL